MTGVRQYDPARDVTYRHPGILPVVLSGVFYSDRLTADTVVRLIGTPPVPARRS